ncbi:Rib/alpha/Esp surface antigen-like repeat protein, partial [Lactobacillus colini]
MKNWISTNEKQRFALKKISGKMVSVLVGTTLFGFYLGTKNNIQVVHADTITASSDVSASLETAKTNTETASTTKNTPAATDSTDNTVKDAASITAATNNNQSTTASTTNNDQETAKTATTADQTADTENKTASTTSTDKEAKPVASNATAATNDNSQSLTPSVDPNKTEEASSTAAVPTSETTTVSTSDLNTTNNQNAKSTLATTLLAATNTTASTTSSEEGLPKSDQVFTLVEAPLYNDIVSTEQTKGRESTWLWKVINSGPYHEQGYNEVKRILQDPNLYYFAAFGDYNNSTHRVILVARDKNNLDNPTITVNIVGFDAGMNTETVKVAANTTKTNTYYNSADKGDYTIQNFGNGSYSITLNTFTNGFGLLPVFDSGHLNNDLVNKTESQYNDIARNESIGIYASYIPKPRTQIIRYVDQATGKDIVQPIDISGYGYQPYRTSDVTPPTVDGYTYKGSSGFATDGSEPQYEELGVPTVGYVTEFSVGEAFDFSETSDVMVRSTVIDKDGTIRSVVYYKGKPLNETAGTSGVKILGTNANNNTMNFTINGLQYTFTNPVTATDNSTVYYYAKTGHEQESTMTVHYIDVTKSGLNSNFIPTDGTEVSKQVLTGNIGEAYTNTLEAPKGYKIVANDETAKSGTYSIDEHDAYVYVKQESPLNEQYDPQPNELTANVGDEVPEAKSQIKNTGDLPADTQYAWQTQPDLSKAGTSTAVVRVTYGDGTYDDVNIPVTVTVKQTEADKYTPNVPTTKVPVDDVNNLTDEEKGQVKTNVEKANPDLPSGATVTVGNDGTATITYGDKSTDTIDGKQLVEAKPDADKYTPNVPTTKVPVNDVNNLTDEEKGQVKTNVEKANPGLPSGATVTVGNDGTATITYGDKSTDTIDGKQLVEAKPDADKYTPNVPTTKVPVNDVTNLTDEEKGQVKTNVEKANPDLPSGATVTVGNDGTATITYSDKSTDTLSGSDLVEAKKDNEKYELKPGKEVKVDDTNKLTDPEKQAVGDAIKEANPDAPIKNIAVDDKGKATVTFNDDSTGEVQGNVVAKKDNEKYELKPGKEVKVDDTNKLTDPEKQAVGDAIKEANPDAPIKNIAVDDKGKATVTFNDDSTGEVQGNIVAKKDNDKYELKPGKEVKVDDTNKLTDPEKQAVGDAIKEANPDAPIKNIEVDDKGKATVTFNDDSTGEVQGNVVAKKDNEKYTPNVPTTKVPVNDVTKLTDEEKGQVKTNVEKANPDLPKDAQVMIGDDGTATITYGDESTDTIAGNQLVEGKKDADKYDLKPGKEVKVDDTNKLTDPEKQAVGDAIKEANPDAPIKNIAVDDKGKATVTFNDDSTGEVQGNIVAKKDNEKYDLKPGNEVKVNDPSHLTDEEKQAVGDAIKEANPDAPIKNIAVDDKGKATVTFNDDSTGEVQGNIVAKKDNDKYELKPGKEVKVDDTNKLTDPEKQAVGDAIKEANPDAPIKNIAVDDKGKATVTFNDDSTKDVQGNIVGKSDADKYTPNVPTTKVPVNDVNNLTEEEKGQVKTNVEKANPNLPSGAEVTIGNDGTATITYSDKSTDTIAGNQLVEAKPESEKYTPNVPATKVPVNDVNNLTEEEKGQVKTNVEKANPDLPKDAEVTIGNDGTATITYDDKSTDTISGSELVTKKPDTSTEQEVKLPDSKVEVVDPNHLTD